MPTLAELRAQLAAENEKSAATTRAVQRELEKRANSGRLSDRDVYAQANAQQKQKFDELHGLFSRGASRVTVESLASVAKELGTDLLERHATDALGEFSHSAGQGLDIGEFARFWTFSRHSVAVTLRAAQTIKATKQEWAARGSRGAVEATGAWRPTVAVNVNATVGQVDADFKASSGVRLCALPANRGDFADDVAAALDAVREGIAAEEDDGEEMAPIEPKSLVAMVSVRLPVPQDAPEESLLECVELFRASANEFNAQDEFPVATKITIVEDDAGKAFELYIFVRRSETIKDESPIAQYEIARVASALNGVLGADDALIEKVLVGVDFGFDARQVFKPNSPHALSALARSMRVSVQASLYDRLVDFINSAGQDEALSDLPFKQAFKKLVPRAVALNLLHSVSATLHYDSVDDAVESMLDDFVEAHVREARRGGETDPARLESVRDEASKAASVIRSYLARAVPLEMRASDVLGHAKLSRIFGVVKQVPAVIVIGSTAAQRARFLVCLEQPSQLSELNDPEPALIDKFMESSGPFPVTLPSGEMLLAFSFNNDQYHRAAAVDGALLVSLVDTSSEESAATDVHDLASLLSRHHLPDTTSEQVQIVAVGNGSVELKRDTGDVAKAATAVVEGSGNVSYQIGDGPTRAFRMKSGSREATFHAAVGGRGEAQLEEMSKNLAELSRLAANASGSDDDDEDDDEGGSMTEIVQTLLFAFRQHVSGISEITVSTNDVTATIKLRNMNMFSLIPQDRESMATARVGAVASLRSQTKARRGNADADDDDFGMLRQASSGFQMKRGGGGGGGRRRHSGSSAEVELAAVDDDDTGSSSSWTESD